MVDFPFEIVLCFLLSTLLLQVLGFLKEKKNISRFFAYLFFFAILSIMLFYGYLVYAQYTEWKEAGPPSSYLVPPYKSISYVFSYHFIRFGMYYAISLFVSLFLLFFSIHGDKKRGNVFFEENETYIAALSIFLLGNPTWGYLWIFYLSAILIVAVLGSFIKIRVLKNNERFSLYFLWIPLAIVAIIAVEFFSIF